MPTPTPLPLTRCSSTGRAHGPASLPGSVASYDPELNGPRDLVDLEWHLRDGLFLLPIQEIKIHVQRKTSRDARTSSQGPRVATTKSGSYAQSRQEGQVWAPTKHLHPQDQAIAKEKPNPAPPEILQHRTPRDRGQAASASSKIHKALWSQPKVLGLKQIKPRGYPVHGHHDI